MKNQISSEKLVQKIAENAWLKKADEILILDLRTVSNRVSDFFIICTGVSDLHIKAVSDGIIEGLKEEGEKPWHVEGLEKLNWVLIDYVDVVTHVLSEESRAFYNLEKLWGDAKQIEINESSIKEDLFAND